MARMNKVCAALAMAGLCTSAQAAPVIAAVAVVAANAAVAATIITTTTALLIGAGVMLASGVYQRNKAKKEARRARDAYNASLKDRLVTMTGATQPLQYIYGRATVASSPVAMFTRGAKDAIKEVVVIWAAHECDAIEDIKIQGESLELDSQGWATASKWVKQSADSVTQTSSTTPIARPSGAALSGVLSIVHAASNERLSNLDAFLVGGNLYLFQAGSGVQYTQAARVTRKTRDVQSQVRVRHYLGTQTTADAQLIANTTGLSGAWSSSDVLRGFCYSIFTLDLNNSDLQSGFPVVTATIRGKKVYDPRTDAVGWSDNPALCIYDFLRSPLYGKGVAASSIQGVIATANACDELITVADGGSTVTAKRYTCNGAWLSEDDPDNVLEDLCRCMAGSAIPGGVWTLQAGVWTPPVMVLDESLAVGPVTMIPAPPRAEAWNGVKGQFYDPGQYNQPMDYEPLQVAAYVDADGGEVWGSLSLPWTDSGWRARTLAAISLEQSRAKSLVWRGSLACLRATVGARVYVNHGLLGLSNASFRVVGRKFVHGERACVELTLTQDQPSYYASVSNVTVTPSPVQPDNSGRVSPPTGLVLSHPAAGQIQVQVDPSPDLAVASGGQLLVQYRLESMGGWIVSPSVPGSQTQQILSGLPAGIYVVRVDWQASNGRTSGEWETGVVDVLLGAWAGTDDPGQAIQDGINDPSDAGLATKGYVKTHLSTQLESADTDSPASKQWVMDRIAEL
ncbi:fibronectin type III domain-containing protein [Comamonas kerstersii]|uniref:fibronectin type III domain-containing protein n=1 Tax=Comamonas kerstersii TaxID=225992 RepID=UPI000985D281|nr:fibronectin type III domain-containing protein [Comamonas kerstersii]